jgi:hypothetical protein
MSFWKNSKKIIMESNNHDEYEYAGFEYLYGRYDEQERIIQYTFARRGKHPFHILAPSAYPFFVAQLLTIFILALVLFFHFVKGSAFLVIFTFLVLLYPITYWFGDVVVEAVYHGAYTVAVQRGLRIGMFLFIISEAMFFFSFF